MKLCLIAVIVGLTACSPSEPGVCRVIQMSEGEHAAHESLPDALRPSYCAIQVISDDMPVEVQFD